MSDSKISNLSAATTPLAGTEVLPIVQSGATKKITVSDLTTGRAVSATQYTSTITTGTAPLVVASTTEVANLRSATSAAADSATSSNAVKSNATTGILQVSGPAAASTRVMTTPDANFTAARTDAAQSFTGDQTLSTGNLVIGTAGKGIDFSVGGNVGGMASELLDDYEEGDWVPALSIGGPITYTSQVGRYTKIGRQVTVYYSIFVSSAAGGAGAVQMNLPFACSGTDVGLQGYPGLIAINGTSNAQLRYTGFYDDTVTVFFYGGATLIGTEVLATSILTGTITYFAAT